MRHWPILIVLALGLWVLSTPSPAQQLGGAGLPIEVKDEGTSQGRVRAVDCVGDNIACTVSANEATLTVSGGSGVDDAEYWVGAAHADLSAEKDLSALSTGLVINTSGTPSAYGGTSCTNQFPRSLNASGAATCASVALAADVSGDLPFANLTQGSALSVLGVTGGSTADVASIAAGSDHQVLRRSGSAVAFGAVNLGQSAAVTGDLPVANVAHGTAGQFFRTNSGATAPEWTTAPFYVQHTAGTFSPGFSPADATTYHMGRYAIFDPSTNYGSQSVVMPHAATIVSAYVRVIISPTNGTAGNVTWYIRKNDTTDTTLGTQQWTSSGDTSFTGFTAVSLATGDTFSIKFTTPTWATNPSAVFIAVNLGYTIP